MRLLLKRERPVVWYIKHSKESLLTMERGKLGLLRAGSLSLLCEYFAVGITAKVTELAIS